MRALVVGADGFAGRWLVRHLSDSGDHVVALVGPKYQPPLQLADRVMQVDVRDANDLAKAIKAAVPDVVYFLAAVSQAAQRESLADAISIGVGGPLNALTACASLAGPVRMVHVSSAHVYGQSGARPVSETAPIEPTTVYGAAKAASERALQALAPVAGVDVVIARPFNHVGPGQSHGFLVPLLVDQIRAITRKERETIRVNALDAVRDYTDVRDIVRAYRLLATRGEPGGIYNVASRAGTSVRELIAIMLELAGVQADVAADSASGRVAEPDVLVGDATKLERIGWSREYTLRQTLTDSLAANSPTQPTDLK